MSSSCAPNALVSTPSPNAAVPNHATGRHAREGRWPFGNSSGIQTPTRQIQTSLSQSSSHMTTPAGCALRVARASTTLLSENRIAIASSSQPIALRGCRLATSAPTTA